MGLAVLAIVLVVLAMVAMGVKAVARFDPVLVDYPQRAVAQAGAIQVVTEREAVPAVEPVEAGPEAIV